VNYTINLLPEELRPRPLVETRRLGMIAAATVAGAAVVVGAGAAGLNFIHQRTALREVTAELTYLQPAAARYDAEKAQERKYQTDARTLEGLVSKQRYWKPVLDQIAAVLPVDAWLDSMDLSYQNGALSSGGPTGKIPAAPAGAAPRASVSVTGSVPPPPNVLVIKGSARSFASIGIFEQNLSVTLPGAAGFGQAGRPLFQQVTLDQVTENNGGEWQFTLTCHLNPL